MCCSSVPCLAQTTLFNFWGHSTSRGAEHSYLQVISCSVPGALPATNITEACHWKRAVLQMGGAEGVSKVERFTLVLSINGGMAMHAVPRPPLGALQPKDTDPIGS